MNKRVKDMKSTNSFRDHGKAVCVVITSEHAAAIKKIALKKGVPFSCVVRWAIQAYLSMERMDG
jgi:predicted DNA binding CopG/RHH family protein